MKKVLLLLSDGFEMLEASPFSDIFGWNAVIGSKDIKVVTAAIEDNVSSIWNFNTKVDIPLKKEKINCSEFNALVIPGGFGRAGFFKDIKEEIFKKIIKEFYESNKYIAAVCTGVFALGEAGILKKKKATTYLAENGRYFKQLEKYGAIPIAEELVVDDKLITSSAPKSAPEVGFLLLEKLSSPENASLIKREMGY